MSELTRTIAKEYPNVTVLFIDIVGFTKISGEMTAEEINMEVKNE